MHIRKRGRREEEEEEEEEERVEVMRDDLFSWASY